MALGKIKADTLEHSTAGSLDTSYVVNGSAKAWASFNQTSTGHPVYDSFNVSGTSDLGAGATKVSFSNAMSNANYSTSGGGQTDGFDATTFGVVGKRTTNGEQMKTTDFTTNNRNQAGSDYDTEYVGSVVHGDLA
jgi:hypothetical protein